MPKQVVDIWNEATEDLATEFIEQYYSESHVCCHWVGNEIGDIFCINDDFWNVDIMRKALTLDVSEKLLFQWYEYSIDCGIEGIKHEVNFDNFVKLKGKIPHRDK